ISKRFSIQLPSIQLVRWAVPKNEKPLAPRGVPCPRRLYGFSNLYKRRKRGASSPCLMNINKIIDIEVLAGLARLARRLKARATQAKSACADYLSLASRRRATSLG